MPRDAMATFPLTPGDTDASQTPPSAILVFSQRGDAREEVVRPQRAVAGKTRDQGAPQQSHLLALPAKGLNQRSQSWALVPGPRASTEVEVPAGHLWLCGGHAGPRVPQATCNILAGRASWLGTSSPIQALAGPPTPNCPISFRGQEAGGGAGNRETPGHTSAQTGGHRAACGFPTQFRAPEPEVWVGM